MNLYIAVIASLFFSALFSGLEIAFITSNKLQIKIDSKKGKIHAKIISLFLKNPNMFITSMFVGNNISLVVYGLTTAIILQPLLAFLFNSTGLIILLQTLVATFVIIFTAEFLPKAIFRNSANKALKVLAIPTLLLYIILFPATIIFYSISKFFSLFTKANIKTLTSETEFNKIDLENFVDENIEDGNTQENEDENNFKIFQNALDFSSVKLRECIVPRTELVTTEVNDTIEEATQKLVESGYSKLIIYEDSIDNIIGYIHISDMLTRPNSIKDILREITFVPETKNAKKLLSQFIKYKQSVAVVVDEFGGTAGIVTIEDIIEEIFGEIEDEHDTIELEERQINENEFIFSGRQKIDYLNETFNLNLPASEEYETLAGFLLHYNEKFPQINSSITIKNINLTVLKITSTRIELIHVKLLEDED